MMDEPTQKPFPYSQGQICQALHKYWSHTKSGTRTANSYPSTPSASDWSRTSAIKAFHPSCSWIVSNLEFNTAHSSWDKGLQCSPIFSPFLELGAFTFAKPNLKNRWELIFLDAVGHFCQNKNDKSHPTLLTWFVVERSPQLIVGGQSWPHPFFVQHQDQASNKKWDPTLHVSAALSRRQCYLCPPPFQLFPLECL